MLEWLPQGNSNPQQTWKPVSLPHFILSITSMSPTRQTPVWGHEAYAATGSGGGLYGSARAFGWTVNSLMVMFFSCTWTSFHQSNLLLLKKKKKRVEVAVSPFLGLKTKRPPNFFLSLLSAWTSELIIRSRTCSKAIFNLQISFLQVRTWCFLPQEV